MRGIGSRVPRAICRHRPVSRVESLDRLLIERARASGDQWADQCRHADPLRALQLADGEALPVQQVKGVAVAVTAVGECPPWIVEPVLPSLKARTIRRANVLQEEQFTLRSQDSVDFGQGLSRIVDSAENECADDSVE